MARISLGRRRGILLLVVLMVLALFCAMLLTFIAVATQFHKSTVAIGRHEQTGTRPRKELDMAMYQLVRGTRNSHSKLLGHDLLSDLYGFDGFQGVIAAATHPGGTGRQFIDLRVDRRSPITNVLGNRVELDNGSGYYNGCVLTIVSQTARPVSTRIVGYDGVRKAFRVMAFDRNQAKPAQLAGARFVVNGRPFNGCGFGWNAATGTLDVMDDGRPVALLPDRSAAARSSVPWPISVQGGPDESYDAPDFQNVFLALTSTNPSETEPSSLLNPSFHRRALVNYWLKQTDGHLPDDLRRKIVLRPNQIDHPGFPRLESLVEGPWDVDNDGDGQRDSVWIDLGFPAQSTHDGRTYKPLFAFLCVDLDGRLNLNAHGNLTAAGILKEPDPVQVAGGVTTSDLRLPRGQGYGPAEISINGLFADPADHFSLLMGVPQRNVPGRYGLDQSIGCVGIDRSSVLKFFEYPDNYLRTANMGSTAFSSPHDLRGRMAMGLDERGDPVFEGLDQSVDDNEYEINLSRGISGRGVSCPASDDLICVAELERILRPYDVDANSLPQRLWQTLSAFRVGPMAAEIRRTVTTDSFDLPVPSVLPTRETRGLFRDFPRGRPLHVIDLLRARLIAGGVSNRDLDAQIEAMLGPGLAMGQRMDVNRPFGNARDDDGNGVVDEPGEAMTGEPLWEDVFRGVFFDHDNDGISRRDGSAYLARHYFARHLYVLMMLLTDPNYLHPVHPGDSNLNHIRRRELSARRLAQWAVNAVDFRDADSIMTPFEYDAYPFDGWDVDGVISTVEDPPDRGVVWGCEYPHLLITETFAMHDTRLVDSSFDTGIGMKRDGSDEELADGVPDDDDLDQFRIPQGSLFVELYCAGHRTTPPHNPAAPRELYRVTPDGAWLDLGRVAPPSRDGTRYPVWRLAISASHMTEARSVRGQVAKHPETCTLQPEAFNLFDPKHKIPIERIVWFSNGKPGPRTIEQNKIFFARSGPRSLLAPGQYAVVGPRRRTFVPRRGDEKKNDGLMISLADLPPSQSPPIQPGINIPPAVGIVAATSPPVSWINTTNTAPEGIGLSVSEPLPARGNYYPEPKYRDVSQQLAVTDAYGLENAGTTSKYYDAPLDNKREKPLKADNLLGEGTQENYKTVFLQRLANPLVRFDSLANPYITVDWMPIDLTVFNSQQEPPTKIPAALRPFNSPQTIPGNIMFATRQRGLPSQPGLATDNVWRAESPRKLGTYENSQRSPPNLRHTLGYLNSTYGTPRTAPTQHIGDPPQPIPWLTFNNRPFVSQFELMLVPCSSPQRLLTEHTTALPVNAYDPSVMIPPARRFGNFRSPFGHLLNFFQIGPINDPFAPPGHSNSPHFYRLFEFTHVPSRFVATDTFLNPVEFANGSGTDSFHPPFNRISNFRDPGRVNLNTINSSRVWDGVLNGHPGPNFNEVVDSRRGYLGVGENMLLDDVPTLIANPFRAGLAGDLVPLAEMARSDVECTLLRSNAIQRGQPPSGGNPLFVNGSQHDYNNTKRNPYYRYEGIRYLGNLVTTHSNVFAVWITVGYFEVQPDTNVPINPDGYQLGQEVGSNHGDIRRHRAFYIIDRTIPVGFELGVNHNVDDAIILRRFIE